MIRFTPPGVLMGAGSPEGTVSAPVGSRYARTDGDTLGDFEWIKESGSGNTGWVAGPGSFIHRNIAAEVTSSEISSVTSAKVRRAGRMVELEFDLHWDATYSTPATVWSIPVGFRAISGIYRGERTYDTTYPVFILSSNDILAYSATADTDARWQMQWLTDDAWPTSLPGSAA